MKEENTIVPTAYLSEKPEGYELKVLLPGIGKGDADLHLENRTLTLKTHASYQAPAGFRPVAMEFEHANYAMSVDLPDMADPATVSARLENGVLLVGVKKRTETLAKKIDIL